MAISPAESAVMEALWRASPRTAEEIAAEVGPEQGWGEATVRTLLHRLTKKKAVATEKDGRRFLYRPLVERADYALAESQDLIDRLFGGKVSPFLIQFSQGRKLTPEDIADLKQMIAELENGR